MTEKTNPADARKKARLAAALRENLKRRKAQTRARSEKPEKAASAPKQTEPGEGRD
jgi:hypothetical protein